MIRYSHKSDVDDIIALWSEAFGDSESEIIFFLDNHKNSDNTLVCEADGKVVSMLFLLEGEMSIKGNLYPSYYLYAACTLNEYRGRGYMSQLLDFARETALKRGYYFICLLPAEKSLYGYYEKYGYKAVFKNKLLKFSLNQSEFASDNSGEEISDTEEARNTFLKKYDYFKWDKSSLDFAFEHYKMYGGQAFVSRKGYMLYIKNDRVVTVKELAFTGDVNIFLSQLKHSDNNIDELTVNLPCRYETSFGEYEVVDHGMMLAVNEEAKKIMSEVDCAYLGLTLD